MRARGQNGGERYGQQRGAAQASKGGFHGVPKVYLTGGR
jgi:hypothetical protein